MLLLRINKCSYIIFDIEFYCTFVPVFYASASYTGAKLTKNFFIGLTLSVKMRRPCAYLRMFNS